MLGVLIYDLILDPDPDQASRLVNVSRIFFALATFASVSNYLVHIFKSAEKQGRKIMK